MNRLLTLLLIFPSLAWGQYERTPSNSAIPSLSITGTGTSCLKAGSDGLTLNADCTNKRVGIGTTSPATKLDVVGDLQVGSGVAKSTMSTGGSLTLASTMTYSVGTALPKTIYPWGLVEGQVESSSTITGSTFTFVVGTTVTFSTMTIPTGAFTQNGDEYTAMCVDATLGTLPVGPIESIAVNGTYYPAAAPVTSNSWQYMTLTLTKRAANTFFVSYRVVNRPLNGQAEAVITTAAPGATARGIYQISEAAPIVITCNAGKGGAGNDLNFIRSELWHGNTGY